jgi:hypothetical protein
MFTRINANCGILELPNITLYISYETVVALKTRVADCEFELKRRRISKTTSRHINLMGCGEFEEVGDLTFNSFLKSLTVD